MHLQKARRAGGSFEILKSLCVVVVGCRCCGRFACEEAGSRTEPRPDEPSNDEPPNPDPPDSTTRAAETTTEGYFHIIDGH